MSLRLDSETAPDGNLEESDPREQIARLEAHIYELAEAMERCRKIILVSKVAIAGGGIWMLAVILGLGVWLAFDLRLSIARRRADAEG